MESWVDILDYVPVIGTAKNVVEAVVALCQGDTAEAAEKGGMALTGLVLDVTTGGVGHIIGTTLAKTAAKGAVKVGTAEVVRMTRAAAIAGNAKTRIDTYKQRRTNKPDIDEPEDRKEKKSKRGEHVINNNVLKVFRSIIDAFLARMGSTMEMVRQAGLPVNSLVSRAYDLPMSPDDMYFIRYEAVARLDEDVVYVDANSEIYGRSVEILRGCCVGYMETILGVRGGQESSPIVTWERILQGEVERITNHDLYVDEMALRFWSASVGAWELQMYRNVKQRVAEMFRVLAYHGGNDDVIQWVNDLRPYLRQ
jgi:hypothetical protein